MKKHALLHLLLICSLILPSMAAAHIKVYVAEFAVTGAPNKDELKVTLQTLLASRLNGERLLVVDAPAAAEVVVSGSYAVIGKSFSLDALVKNSAGTVMTRAFAQGESQEELLPAVGKLAQTLTEGIIGAQPVPPLPPADIVRKEAAVPAPDIIKAPPMEKVGATGWISQRLNGAMVAMAPGRTLENGDKELYIADKHSLKLYRLARELTLVSEVALRKEENILTIDTADLDGDGVQELYVTIQTLELLTSQVWQVKGNAFVRIAEKLPYFFRGIALAGGEKKIYVQQMGRDADFYGDVMELVKAGDKYEMKNPLKLHRFGFLYNFNQFTDAAGRLYFVVLHEDGYLLVYNKEGEELWRSNEKYGGSEVYFIRDDLANVRITGDPYRWIYLEQRIVVTKEGEIIVPQNSSDWAAGKVRSYRKSTVCSLGWNGSSLEEKWHTRESQNYLADFSYDQEKKELVLLQVVKKEGVFSKGASAVAIKKVE